MNAPSKTGTAMLLTFLGAACASAPPVPAPVVSKPQTVSSSTGAATASGPAPAPATALDLKTPLAPGLVPMKVDPMKLTVAYDRVALIWGFPSCLVRPWVVTVVDLGTRMITFRGLAASSELDLYFPSPTGEACYKGPCPTMAVEMAIPLSLAAPSLYSGTGTMMGGTGKGRYALPSGTSCPEPPMLDDAGLVDLASRLVQGRNDAAAAVGARAPVR